jgi:TonB-dependent SusC/RagA subfamily outer membrane receptor
MSTSSLKSVIAILLVVGIAACAQNAASTSSAGSQAAAPQRPRNSVVDSTIIASAVGQQIEKIIADHVAGVRLGHTADGSLSLQIRGASGYANEGQPLYIIDGNPMSPGAGLSGINPMDIATIEVVKDAASLSMYGTRGSNGVVIIKMKKVRP